MLFPFWSLSFTSSQITIFIPNLKTFAQEQFL